MVIVLAIAIPLLVALLCLLIKGGVTLVAKVLGVAVGAVIDAVGLLIAGIVYAVVWTSRKLWAALAHMVTEKRRRAERESDSYEDWMRQAHH